MSNKHAPDFTDQELMTVYLFGLLQKRATLRDTYDYIRHHWAEWLPKLPSCQAISYRLNQIAWRFESLIDSCCGQLQKRPDLLEDVLLVDSVPIILSPQPNTARVAPEVADKGHAATRKLWYHGLNRTVDAVASAGYRPAGPPALTATGSAYACLGQ